MSWVPSSTPTQIAVYDRINRSQSQILVTPHLGPTHFPTLCHSPGAQAAALPDFCCQHVPWPFPAYEGLAPPSDSFGYFNVQLKVHPFQEVACLLPLPLSSPRLYFYATQSFLTVDPQIQATWAPSSICFLPLSSVGFSRMEQYKQSTNASANGLQ